MKKKLLSALLCVAMVASLVVGCGSKPAEAPAEDAATEEVTEDAAEENPNKKDKEDKSANE